MAYLFTLSYFHIVCVFKSKVGAVDSIQLVHFFLKSVLQIFAFWLKCLVPFTFHVIHGKLRLTSVLLFINCPFSPRFLHYYFISLNLFFLEYHFYSFMIYLLYTLKLHIFQHEMLWACPSLTSLGIGSSFGPHPFTFTQLEEDFKPASSFKV